MPVCLHPFEESPFSSRQHIQWHIVIRLLGLKEYEVVYAHKYKTRCTLVGVPIPSFHSALRNEQMQDRGHNLNFKYKEKLLTSVKTMIILYLLL